MGLALNQDVKIGENKEGVGAGGSRAPAGQAGGLSEGEWSPQRGAVPAG